MNRRPVPMRVVVVDDEAVARAYLSELIEETGLGTIVAAVESAALARQVLDPATGVVADVVFMDVRLAERGNPHEGLELTRAYAHAKGAPLFVLATASSEHALLAYDLGVFDYLRKPFTSARVERCLRRARDVRGLSNATPPARLVARRSKSVVFLPIEDAWAFEASERFTYVHTGRGRLDLDVSLSAVEGQLGERVLRVHRNWLVHVDRVLEMTRDAPDTVLRVGTVDAPIVVPVSRERTAEIRAALLERLAGRLARRSGHFGTGLEVGCAVAVEPLARALPNRPGLRFIAVRARVGATPD